MPVGLNDHRIFFENPFTTFSQVKNTLLVGVDIWDIVMNVNTAGLP